MTVDKGTELDRSAESGLFGAALDTNINGKIFKVFHRANKKS